MAAGAGTPARPQVYRTAEGQDIRVSVLARLRLPYGMAFLPDGDLLVTQRTGDLAQHPAPLAARYCA